MLPDAVASGDRKAAAEFPLVYDELRKRAAARRADKTSGSALQPMALVDEGSLRLIGLEEATRWENRAHFFYAAAEALRRIRVEAAHCRYCDKRGGELQRIELNFWQRLSYTIRLIPLIPSSQSSRLIVIYRLTRNGEKFLASESVASPSITGRSSSPIETASTSIATVGGVA